MRFSRQIVSVVAAVVLAVHVVVGCCAHHLHPAAGTAELGFAAGHGEHQHSHNCRHHSSEPAGPASDSGPCDHACDEGSCSFLAGSKLVLPDLNQPAASLAASSSAELGHLAPCSLAVERILEPDAPPAVRSHLGKCVLLI